MIKFEEGKYIYFTKAESAPMMEHLCRIDEIVTNSDLSVKRIGTKIAGSIIKQVGPDGPMSAIVPFFGMASYSNDDMIYINIDQFDFIGECTNAKLISELERSTSPLIDATKLNKVPEKIQNPGFHLV